MIKFLRIRRLVVVGFNSNPNVCQRRQCVTDLNFDKTAFSVEPVFIRSAFRRFLRGRPMTNLHEETTVQRFSLLFVIIQCLKVDDIQRMAFIKGGLRLYFDCIREYWASGRLEFRVKHYVDFMYRLGILNDLSQGSVLTVIPVIDLLDFTVLILADVFEEQDFYLNFQLIVQSMSKFYKYANTSALSEPFHSHPDFQKALLFGHRKTLRNMLDDIQFDPDRPFINKNLITLFRNLKIDFKIDLCDPKNMDRFLSFLIMCLRQHFLVVDREQLLQIRNVIVLNTFYELFQTLDLSQISEETLKDINESWLDIWFKYAKICFDETASFDGRYSSRFLFNFLLISLRYLKFDVLLDSRQRFEDFWPQAANSLTVNDIETVKQKFEKLNKTLHPVATQMIEGLLKDI